jgi:hypothetical protein
MKCTLVIILIIEILNQRLTINVGIDESEVLVNLQNF